MITSNKPDVGTVTREKLLDVAEEMFAKEGFDDVTLRALTTEAGVNIAAVNYHFRGKQGLIDAVVLRHIEPINKQRRLNLEKLKETEGALTVSQILNALFAPFVEHVMRSDRCCLLLMKFMARICDAHNPRIPTTALTEMKSLLSDYVTALTTCLPHTPEADVWKRVHFTYGVFVTTMMHNEMLTEMAGDRVGTLDVKELLDEIVEFCAAGFTALDSSKA